MGYKFLKFTTRLTILLNVTDMMYFIMSIHILDLFRGQLVLSILASLPVLNVSCKYLISCLNVLIFVFMNNI